MRIQKGVELVDWQMQRVQDQIGGFVECVVAAVAEEQFGGVKARDGVAQQVTDGRKIVDHGNGLERQVKYKALPQQRLGAMRTVNVQRSRFSKVRR